MKRLFISVVLVLISISFINAQQQGAFISFEKETHDYGKIKESDGKVEYKFVFTNTGNTPLIINKVKASCGCTSPTWTEKPIMPGQKGFVSAVFDPKNRPGNFNKTIFVESNSKNSRIVLRIKGEVIARTKTVNDYYPKELGQLRLETNHFAFVRVYNNQVKTDTLKIYNSSDSDLKITFENIPAYLKLVAKPAVLKPGKKGYIIGTYDGAKVNDWGFVSSRIKVLINGVSGNRDYITISAKVEENFSKLSEKEIANAPQIVFDNISYYFGKTKSTDKIEHDFKFKNEGKSDLIIRKIRSTCGCTTVAPEKTVIKPGESSSFKAIFTPGSRKGKQRKSIYVISNDPKKFNVRLLIKGEIITDQKQNDTKKYSK
ncbi:MAG: DUF1573 domain-containing protein [Bacteroidales bacterium]|jgi:hypothetical protein|nr:DUF1573 domain-containing protein [Bacteroidales bacterium]